MSGNETWKPLMTLCTLLATFEKDLPSKTSPNTKDSAAEVRKSLNSYMDATNNLVKGLATVIEEISKHYLDEKMLGQGSLKVPIAKRMFGKSY